MDFSAAGELVYNVALLAKEVGKGGGGSTDEPTVCMVLLPIGLGIGAVALGSVLRRLRGRSQEDGHGPVAA